MNVVSSGVVPTPAYSNSLGMSQEQIDQFVQGFLAGIPLGRPGTTDEVAKAVSILASDESSYINGVEPFADGGLAQVRSACPAGRRRPGAASPNNSSLQVS